MKIDRNAILQLLENNQVAFQYFEHPAVFTAEEALTHCGHLAGMPVKNLFLRDHKKSNYILLTVNAFKRVDLSALSERLNLTRLSFASAEDLSAKLALTPGSVTPFGIFNALPEQVTLYFDSELKLESEICIHPMDNTATIIVKLADLLKLIKDNSQHQPGFIEVVSR